MAALRLRLYLYNLHPDIILLYFHILEFIDGSPSGARTLVRVASLT